MQTPDTSHLLLDAKLLEHATGSVQIPAHVAKLLTVDMALMDARIRFFERWFPWAWPLRQTLLTVWFALATRKGQKQHEEA